MESLSTTPHSFKKWAYEQNIDVSDDNYPNYLEYLKTWYQNRKVLSSENKNLLKLEYIQLLKDLSFLFNDVEKNKFLKNIDYTNDEEIIYNIPFFAKKIKEIAKVLMNKRESVKNAKIKYNMVGSNQGVESILYDYVLRSFTKKEGNVTQIPTSIFHSLIPALSSIKDDFYIEIEELHDPSVYHDSDPSVNISSYQNVGDILGDLPYEDLTEDELTGILATRFLPSVADSTISKLIKSYMNYDDLNATNVADYSIEATKAYLGEPKYALTALKLSEFDASDKIINISLKIGNNWFLWPSGYNITTDYAFNNIYQPIEINKSMFLSSSATFGSSYKESDLIFTEKNGCVEGAWLLGNKIYTTENNLSIEIVSGTKRQIRFPYPLFKISSKGKNWGGFSLDEKDSNLFYSLDNTKREELLSRYFTETYPNSAVNPIKINQTTLVYDGAYSGIISTEADTVFKTKPFAPISTIYSESDHGESESAFLYKAQKTDLPIQIGTNNIYWPYVKFSDGVSIPLTIKDDTCIPIRLKETTSKNFIGSISGPAFQSADVIYKLDAKSNFPTEAAYYQSGSTDNLDIMVNAITVYDRPADRCSKYITGAVQNALCLKINPSEKVSFIWSDVDTYADDVFKFFKHSDDCPYKNATSNYYDDQDFVNDIESTWEKCTCKSVFFSPVGHVGDNIYDYNGVTDMLFHDPDGLGADFSLSSWIDTRNYNAYQSPQFSYYRLNDSDKKINWGRGYWKTGNGQKMVLKCGKRYTYYRTPFRKNSTDTTQSPYYVIKYPYKKITGLCAGDYSDIVILWDRSKTQEDVFQTCKRVILTMAEKIIGGSNSKTQISVISFDTNTADVAYLTNDFPALKFSIGNVAIRPEFSDYQTNIKEGLEAADYILYNQIPSANDSSSSGQNAILNICRNLQAAINDGSTNIKINNRPRPDANKKIIILSDGFDSYNAADTIAYAKTIKTKGVEIHSVDFGDWSFFNTLMETIATDANQTYFNLQKYLIHSDGDIDSFGEYISKKINGCEPSIPKWSKAIKNSDGAWVGTSEDSDLVLRAGDYLVYEHKSGVSHTGEDTNSNFTTNAINFTVNVKLDGWNYGTNNFSMSSIGINMGGKPFWAKSYTNQNIDNRFEKETMVLGGHIRFFEEYTPVTQPEISEMTLENGSVLTYQRSDGLNLRWKQPLTFTVTESTNRWKKLKVNTGVSNLSEILKNNTLDRLVYETYEDSDILLESYSDFKPAYYNYYARNPFNYTENLFLINRDVNSFVQYITGKFVTPHQPYANLTNVHYPTVAVSQVPKNLISEKQVGYYLLPERLGVSFYNGRGFLSELSNDQLTYVDSLSAERVYYDLEKYGNRNRGLSKNDQITISKIKNIESRWISESYFNNERSGMIQDPQKFQKFTPYQSNYETIGVNSFGLSRQDDDLDLWFPVNPATWKDKNYKLTFREEVTSGILLEKINNFLIDQGVLVQWKTDIYGNEYGVFKNDGSVVNDFADSEWYQSLLAYLESLE